MSDDAQSIGDLAIAVHNAVVTLAQALAALQAALVPYRRAVFHKGGEHAVTDFVANFGVQRVSTDVLGFMLSFKVLNDLLKQCSNLSVIRMNRGFAPRFQHLDATALDTARRPDADPLDLPGVKVHTRSER